MAILFLIVSLLWLAMPVVEATAAVGTVTPGARLRLETYSSALLNTQDTNTQPLTNQPVGRD